ncbi:MAG: hypothetical protein MRZ36_03900 [Eubacterium sp.]|nr:hypothetical protein [Eubacterium sp.]
MGKRREIIRRCRQIRDYVADNQFTTALELIDTLPLAQVESVEDLYLYADLYEKAERMEKKKEIYFIIYNRTKSRHVLEKLLRLVLRMGDMKEARELFLAYEFSGEATLTTFELRYLLARAEGESRNSLIQILEELKKEEYTEEWGYQLARLYEYDGRREDAIRECKDLQLWFGEGPIIDKAVELQARLESPDWQQPKEEGIPEPEFVEKEERIYYAAAPVRVTELSDEDEEEKKEEQQPVDVVEPEDAIEEEVTETEEIDEPVVEEALEEEASTEEPVEEPDSAPESELVLEPQEDTPEQTKSLDKILEETAPLPKLSLEGVSEPVVGKKNKNLKPRTAAPIENLDDLLAKEPEDISEHGILYRTLKNTIHHVRCDNKEPHFVFAGGEERITLAVAKRITKELNNLGYFQASSIVKITSEKLNGLNLDEQIEKLSGGCMLITDAAELNEKSTQDLIRLMHTHGEYIVVMLAGPFDEMDCYLANYPELAEQLYYKVRM